MIHYDPASNTFLGGKVATGSVPNVMWHVTDVCPLGCPFCFAPKTAKSTPADRVPRLVQAMQAIGVQKVDISGGEPLIYEDLPIIVESLAAASIHQTITTSGVGPASAHDFVVTRRESFSRVIVSVDAPGSDHDHLRRHPKAWSSLNGFIRALPADFRAARLRINTVVTAPFIRNEWLNSVAAWVSDTGAYEWCLIQPHPANAKLHFQEYDVDSEEFLTQLDAARRLSLIPRLTYRTREMYSSYWAIHPDGTLRQHTGDAHDGVIIDLLHTATDDVIRVLRDATSTVPTTENSQ